VQVGADLAHRDRHQPGPELARVTQRRQIPDGAQHRVLHDVVDVGIAP
jgi:hypothetical protein